MGFPYDVCLNALNASQGDEMVALNTLLDGNKASGTAQAPPSQTTDSKEPKAGLFGRVWGKK
jgi:hypothetical protein